MVGSVNDWQKEKQFQKLNAQKEERNVKALRGGQERLMSVYDVVVGDILFLEPGEIVPVDGVFLAGHNVRCDESGATGESDAVRKAPFDEIDQEGAKGKTDCFMISGSKVVEGVGRYVVTSVGRNSFHGKIMMCASGPSVLLLPSVHRSDSPIRHPQRFRATPKTRLSSSSSTRSPSSSRGSVPPPVSSFLSPS